MTRARRETMLMGWPLVAAAGAAMGIAGIAGSSPSLKPEANGRAASSQPLPDRAGESLVDIETLGRRFSDDRFFTKPSKDAEIGFQLPTQVMEIAVKGGDPVERGALMIRGDDAEELALLEIQRMRAESDLPVRRAREQFELAKVEFEMQEKAFRDGGSTEQDVNRARVNMRIAELDVDQARMNLGQEQLQLDRLEARMTRFRLTAPFDGVVESVQVSVGDTVQESQPIIRVVQIDPLWIDVHAPVRDVVGMGLAKGDPAWALVGVSREGRVVQGRIIEISPVAEFASRRRRVRVEIPNPDRWPPGLAAWVRFAQPPENWQDPVQDRELSGTRR